MTKKKNKKERKLEKELMWIIGFLAFLVVVYLISSSIFKSLNSFEYEGLTFTKERLGEIPVYHYYYYFDSGEGELIKYNLYLRNDPREVDIAVDGGNIIFDHGKRVYVSVDPSGLQECSQSVLAIADLSSFLTDNQLDVRGGNVNFWEAGANRQEWVTCESKPKNVVITVREGEETRIDISGENDRCIDIQVSNCEILEAVEKFKIQSVIDAMDYP